MHAYASPREKERKKWTQRSLVLNETIVDIKETGWKSTASIILNLWTVVIRGIRLVSGRRNSVNMKNTECGDMSAQPIYGVLYRRHNIPRTLVAGTIQVFWVEVENCGTKTWVRQEPQGHNVDLVLYLDGELHAGATLPSEAVNPGDSAILSVQIRVPDKIGPHVVSVDMVEQNVTYFADQGVDRLEVPLQVVRKSFTAGQTLGAQALRQNESFFWPTEGVTVGTDGFSYPVFTERAEGCFITDVDGRCYVDYVMGWGSAWLGYAHPAIQNAIRKALDSAAIPTLAHRLEMEVTGILCDEIPCAEKVLFGKNGSDVCTAAVRLARAATGRRLILVSGYHGWQDWYLQSGGFASPDAVPEIPDCVIHFRFNDAEHLEELLKQYKAQVAAVMLEPGAAIESLNGPVHNANEKFLSLAADLTRREGALLIFDEVFTGFRYPGGSVQKALDITPDLACFGKALGGGMPLSALVGSSSAFSGLGKIFYGPSFRGEVYSLAAAHAALNIYSTTDVVSQVWSFGESLRQGLNYCCRDAGVPAEVVGPPIRMVLSFREDDPQRIILMRTLLQQELLKAYIITYRGFMLPSLAHDEAVLKQTLEAFSEPLKVLAEAIRNDDFVSRLQVPPMA